jgi:hypothetical protein
MSLAVNIIKPLKFKMYKIKSIFITKEPKVLKELKT